MNLTGWGFGHESSLDEFWKPSTGWSNWEFFYLSSLILLIITCKTWNWTDQVIWRHINQPKWFVSRLRGERCKLREFEGLRVWGFSRLSLDESERKMRFWTNFRLSTKSATPQVEATILCRWRMNDAYYAEIYCRISGRLVWSSRFCKVESWGIWQDEVSDTSLGLFSAWILETCRLERSELDYPSP